MKFGHSVRRGGAFVALLVLMTGCTSPTPTPTPTPHDTSTAGLDRFYGQELSWGACEDYAITTIERVVFAGAERAECGRLDVPLDYQDPEGRTATLAVMRVPARGEAIGSLVMNPGGPGGSGLFGVAATAASLPASRLTERFDIVGFDPRGVGASEPAIDCYSDAEAERGDVWLTTQGTTVQWTEEDTKEVFERCADGSGGADALVSVGTRDAARDIDVLRAVLGDEQLTFLGQSYGTRLGAVYAEQFPQNVRAMLLDGGIDPHQRTVERRVSAYSGFQRAFDQMAAFCLTQDDCPLGDDPDRAVEVFQQIMRPLYRSPVPALDSDLDFDEGVGGVVSGLYSEVAWPRVIAGIAEVQQGRGDELLQMGYDFALSGPGVGWTNLPEANYAINCMDEDRLTEEQGNALRRAVLDAAPFMDPGVDLTGARDGCEHWPTEPTLGFPYATDIEGLPPTLVVSITGDPTTPHSGGINLSRTLGSALLTVEGEGHTVVTGGTNTCVDAVAADYLIDLVLPPADATCAL